MTQDFTVTLTGEEAAQLRELADHWRMTPNQALRHAAVSGIDMELQIKHHDEEQANPTPRKAGPGGDLDDGIDVSLRVLVA